ncbi:hypothetical protein [Natrononativus amylolyticus]|uniref:hypothetical protein n=1 Tax=Natrononativus amylolyticus TaxID=2963434 RepID=UPI0020CEE881|nr:hypothetical protein [Natrononativus amylolyticus]
MVEKRITDGRRIAELLSSELDGRTDDELRRMAVANVDDAVEATADGGRAYDVERDGERFARVFVHPDRVRLEFDSGREAAVEAATDLELRTRPKASQPPKTLVFVESGAEVKRATDVVQAASRALEDEERSSR